MKNKCYNFKLAHLNCRSILPSFLDFSHVVISENFDIIAVTETWLSCDVDSNRLNINGYNLFRSDRPQGRGGGVAIYIKNEFVFHQIQLTTNITNLENLFITIKLKNENICIGVIYRPPQNNLNICIEEFDNLLSLLVPQYNKIVILGDVNVNLLRLDNPLSICFDTHNFTQIINEPTRITEFTSTLLDPIFVNDNNMVKNQGTINVDIISDHRLVFVDLDVNIVKNKQKVYTYRSFGSFSQDAFNSDLYAIAWDNLLYFPNIDDKVEFLNYNIDMLFNRHAPIRTARMNKPHAPWLTDALQKLMRERDRAFTTYKINNTPENWNRYKDIRNYLLYSIRREKKAYLNFSKVSDPAEFWKKLKSLNITGKSTTDIPSNLKNPSEINKYFLSLFNTKQIDEDTLQYYNNNQYSNNDKFSFTMTEPQTVGNILCQMKSNAAGHDGLSLQMVKLCLPMLLNYITHIINCCLETGYFPESWKHAVICPVPKTNNPTVLNDLRPISILPVLSKVLEKVAALQLTEYLQTVSNRTIRI